MHKCLIDKPAAAPKAANAPSSRATSPTMLQGSGKRLLAVDDTPANLEPLVLILEAQDYEVSVALNGERALALAGSIKPDVILLDIAMPGMDGLEVCRRLKSDPETEQIPVIFLTAGSDRLTEAYELGAADCLIRPVNEAHMLARVYHSVRLRELAKEKIQAVEAEQGDRFHALVNTVPDGIVTIDADCIIETFNPAAERLFGYAADEVIGLNVNVLMPMPYQAEHDGYVNRYLETGQARIIGLGREVVGRRKDGSEFPLELAVGEFAMSGRRMFAGILRDITERKRAQEEKDALNVSLKHELGEKENALERLKATQEQMIQTEKMAALGGLVAGVAHEINTPVGIGVTAASTLGNACKDLQAELDANALSANALQKFLDTSDQLTSLILRNLSRAANLIASFKLVAVDQASDQKRHFGLAEYVHEVLKNVEPKLRQSRVELKVDIPTDIEMDSYPGAVAVVLTNLVLNSIVHGFEGEVAGPAVISILAEIQNDWVQIEYADNGKGMTAAVKGKAFDPFFTTKRGQGGSGLGLHLVYNLVTQSLKGTVSIDSEEGCGTAILLRLPLRTP